MPLLRFDIYTGWSESEIETMLDAAHEAMLAAFQVPARDRYQIVHEHPPARMIMQDTGLGLTRSARFVCIQVTTRARSRAMKERFYRLVTEALERRCGIDPADVMINLVTVTDEDWSFGLGRAQFLTGEL